MTRISYYRIKPGEQSVTFTHRVIINAKYTKNKKTGDLSSIQRMTALVKIFGTIQRRL